MHEHICTHPHLSLIHITDVYLEVLEIGEVINLSIIQILYVYVCQVTVIQYIDKFFQ